jgi:Fe-Mn family superoxide dismutase
VSIEADRQQQLRGMVDAAQRAAGVLAARHRGDADGVRTLMASFHDEAALAGGALLLADLALGMLRERSGQSMDECVQHLSVRLENVVSGG